MKVAPGCGDGHGQPRRLLSLSLSPRFPFGRDAGHDPRTGRERPLVEMLSVSDWRSFVPETFALLAAIWLVRAALPGGIATPGMPHPLWVPVLLMSVQYGVMGGIFATLVATATFFLGGLPERSAAQDFYAYAAVVSVQPCAWFGTALIVGGLRTLHIHHQTQMLERLEQTRVSAEDLADGLERAVGEISRLERRIAADSSTLTSFIDSLGRIDLSDRASLAAGMADVICRGVGATSFAVHLKGTHGLEPFLGVENGASVAPGALAPLDASLLEGPDSGDGGQGSARQADGDRPDWTPQRAPIRAPDSDEVLGIVICSRLLPSQDPAATSRRLPDLCRTLAVLLSACPPTPAIGAVHDR